MSKLDVGEQLYRIEHNKAEKYIILRVNKYSYFVQHESGTRGFTIKFEEIEDTEWYLSPLQALTMYNKELSNEIASLKNKYEKEKFEHSRTKIEIDKLLKRVATIKQRIDNINNPDDDD